jgi:hypothetical protein
VVRLGDGGRQSEQTEGGHNTGQLELCPCVGCGSPVAKAFFGRAAMDAPIAEEGLFSGWQRLARREVGGEVLVAIGSVCSAVLWCSSSSSIDVSRVLVSV